MSTVKFPSKQKNTLTKPSELEKFRLFFEYVKTDTKAEERRKAAERIMRRPPKHLLLNAGHR